MNTPWSEYLYWEPGQWLRSSLALFRLQARVSHAGSLNAFVECADGTRSIFTTWVTATQVWVATPTEEELQRWALARMKT